MDASSYRHDVAGQYRVTLPRAERRHPWLARLFDLYAMVDASVADALALAAQQGATPACAKGCNGCCHQPIPLTPLEAAGLQWYIREEMPPEILAALRAQSDKTGSNSNPSCRFLLRGICAAYLARPVACRRYMVLGTPCAPTEDATATRPRDVLRPSREALNAAYATTLPYYAALGETVPEPLDAFAFMAERTVPLGTLSANMLGKK